MDDLETIVRFVMRPGWEIVDRAPQGVFMRYKGCAVAAWLNDDSTITIASTYGNRRYDMDELDLAINRLRRELVRGEARTKHAAY